jgi:hypothetical protein
LLKTLTKGQQEIPDRDVIGYGGRSNRTEIDGVERSGSLEPVHVHHAAVTQVVIATPRQFGEGEGNTGAARRGFNRGETSGDDFFADPVAGNDGN